MDTKLKCGAYKSCKTDVSPKTLINYNNIRYCVRHYNQIIKRIKNYG